MINQKLSISEIVAKLEGTTLGMDDGRRYIQGNIEVYYKGEWGTICEDQFNRNNNGAIVVCRMMGYSSGDYSSSYRQATVTPSTRIWLDNVQCVGTVTHIDRCQHDNWGSHTCTHNQDVAIRCYGNLPLYIATGSSLFRHFHSLLKRWY